MANANLPTTVALVLKINVAGKWQMFTISKIYFFKRGRDDMTVDIEGVTSFE